MTDKIKWQLQNIYLQLLANKNTFTHKYNANNFIWINGSGRSGTTWLGELLANIPNSKLVDEPLRKSDSKKLLQLNFRGIQHIPQDSTDWKEIVQYFDRFFATAEFNPNHFHMDISGVNNVAFWIIKEIRSHLFLPWLIDRYKLNKVINIIRNPYHVIGSQLVHGSWNKEVKQFDFSSFRYQEYYKQYEYLYKPINSNIEYLAFEWCLQNSYLLNHNYNEKKWLNVRYEDLCTNPTETIEKIFTYLQIDIPNSIYGNINKTSNSGKSNKEEKQLNAEQKEIINYYLKEFNLLNI
jgi:hypothetical protein